MVSAKAIVGASARRLIDASELTLLRLPQRRLHSGAGDDERVPIVIIHLGSRFPPYLRACVAQVERVGGRPLIVGHSRAARYSGDQLARFRSSEALSAMGGRRFWRYACERFFVLEEFMRESSIDRCVHIESDVLLYQAAGQLAAGLEATYGDEIAVCPLTDAEDTAAVMYVGSLVALRRFNAGLLQLVMLGADGLLARYGGSMANEMRMLHVLRTQLDLCAALTTTIEQATASGVSFLFDPASYGQWVDGIPGQPGIPYAGEHHAIGREFLSGNYELFWDAQVRVPKVRIASEPQDAWPLANLHVHSKRLALFVAHTVDRSA
jgi:hypothetical protein